MVNLHVREAYSFYKKFILDYSRGKAEIYKQYGFTLQGSIGSKDWEVFSAILMGDKARSGDGADLVNYEVKSASIGNSFEYQYQYHKNQGLKKLEDDKSVEHIFIARSKTYQDVEVWLVDRAELIPVFDGWLPELRQNYTDGLRQRFRRSITYKLVSTRGDRIFEVKNGELIYPVE